MEVLQILSSNNPSFMPFQEKNADSFCFFLYLPKDIQINIINFLSLKEYYLNKRVSKNWHDLSVREFDEFIENLRHKPVEEMYKQGTHFVSTLSDQQFVCLISEVPPDIAYKLIYFYRHLHSRFIRLCSDYPTEINEWKVLCYALVMVDVNQMREFITIEVINKIKERKFDNKKLVLLLNGILTTLLIRRNPAIDPQSKEFPFAATSPAPYLNLAQIKNLDKFDQKGVLNLIGAGMDRCDFSHVHLLENKQWECAYLWLANLQCFLKNCNFKNASLIKANMENAIVENCQIEGGNLSWANLKNTTWKNSDLRNANLMYADLTFAIFENVKLSGVKLNHASFFTNLPQWAPEQLAEVLDNLYKLLTTMDDELKIDWQAAILRDLILKIELGLEAAVLKTHKIFSILSQIATHPLFTKIINKNLFYEFEKIQMNLIHHLIQKLVENDGFGKNINELLNVMHMGAYCLSIQHNKMIRASVELAFTMFVKKNIKHILLSINKGCMMPQTGLFMLQQLAQHPLMDFLAGGGTFNFFTSYFDGHKFIEMAIRDVSKKVPLSMIRKRKRS